MLREQKMLEIMQLSAGYAKKDIELMTLGLLTIIILAFLTLRYYQPIEVVTLVGETDLYISPPGVRGEWVTISNPPRYPDPESPSLCNVAKVGVFISTELRVKRNFEQTF